ncbi:MAG TPA: DUF1835 domain-containing protein [Gemmatimonadaceae bacterium]
MQNVLHITNGDSAVGAMRAGGIGGEIVAWRDVLHDGPVPSGLSLVELSRVRARWLAEENFGDLLTLQEGFDERDSMLRRYADFDEVVLWFEWDLYDQLQLIQILDFLADDTAHDRAETGTKLSIVSFEGYLGSLSPDRFADLYEQRREISDEMLHTGRAAWKAFRSADPRDLEQFAAADTPSLEFLQLSLWRHLEEFPSSVNGLSRSESQILEAVAQGPLAFHELFRQVANREERMFCGDATMARYIERMSLTTSPLILYTSGDRIDAPRTEEDSRAFRNAEMCLTATGREVLNGANDWITLGGSDRWLGGAHLDRGTAEWRWNPDTRHVVKAATENAA